jgi:hypothetical protein
MNEDIGKIIGEGFGTWKKNLNLAAPFVANVIAIIIAVIPFAMGLVLVASNISGLPEGSLEGMTPDEIIASIGSANIGSVLTEIALLIIALIIVIILISAFFTAGAIGMARQAIMEGKSRTGTIWPVGRKHFVNFTLISAIMGLISLAGLVFLLPGVLSIPEEAFSNPDALPGIGGTAIGLLMAGFILFIIYELALSVALSMASYALVVDDLGPIGSLKAGLEFFRRNKFDVFVLWLVVLAISMSLEVLGSSASVNLASDVQFHPWSILTGLVSILVLSPLSTVWYTLLYLSRTGKLESREVKDQWS